MTGAKYRPTSLGGKTRYYNILFLVKDLVRLDKVATKKNITRAELVREAVHNLLREEDGKDTI